MPYSFSHSLIEGSLTMDAVTSANHEGYSGFTFAGCAHTLLYRLLGVSEESDEAFFPLKAPSPWKEHLRALSLHRNQLGLDGAPVAFKEEILDRTTGFVAPGLLRLRLAEYVKSIDAPGHEDIAELKPDYLLTLLHRVNAVFLRSLELQDDENYFTVLDDAVNLGIAQERGEELHLVSPELSEVRTGLEEKYRARLTEITRLRAQGLDGETISQALKQHPLKFQWTRDEEALLKRLYQIMEEIPRSLRAEAAQGGSDVVRWLSSHSAGT